ncbi:MAG: hypothetical protein KDD69_12255, partial [Bdellovibrionales bacterium]|nr:hypothetical protein [Bdellovibrionales bacterium]
EFTPPEILRTPLTETMLDLAADGLTFGELRFLDHPGAEGIAQARSSLVALGFLDQQGKITPNGREAVRYPVECHVDRMILEARKCGCVSEMLEIAALLQVGSLEDRRAEDPEAWSRLVGPERVSDLFSQVRAYRAAKTMSRSARKATGVMAKKVDEVTGIVRKLKGALSKRDLKPDNSGGGQDQILRCICAGMVDHVFRHEGGGFYRDVDCGTRGWKLDRDSALAANPPEWIVGVPFYAGRMTLIQSATAIDPAWMQEVAPHLCTREVGTVAYDPAKDWVERTVQVLYRGHEIARKGENVPADEASRVFCTWLVSQLRWSFGSGDAARDAVFVELREKLKAVEEVNRRAGRVAITLPNLVERFAELLGNPRCLGDVQSWDALRVIAEELAQAVTEIRPKAVEVCGQLLPVDYSAPTPQITVGEEDWAKLPPSGLTLPSGEKLAICFTAGGLSFGPSTNASFLIHQAADRLVEEARAVWRAPELELPSLKDLRQNFPALQRVEVCRHALTGKSVCKFGALIRTDFGTFEWSWSEDRVAQEAARKAAEEAVTIRGGVSDRDDNCGSGRTLWGQRF